MTDGVCDPTDALNSPAGPLQGIFDGFLEAAPDPVVIIDGGGGIVQVNHQTEKLFGYSREELVGCPVEVLMPERFRQTHVAQRQSYSASPHARPMGQGLDLFGLRKDGSEFPIDVSLSPLPTAVGVLVASAIRDMTAHRNLQNELRRRTLELEEADRQKDRFLSAVAHELRSPLSVLTQVSEILKHPQASQTARQNALGVLERQTIHMARLIEDLLDLSRVRSGKVRLCQEPIDLRTVLPQAVEISHPVIEDRKHHLSVTPCPQPLWVSGDAGRLSQVISNLLTNAAKYTPQGGHIGLSVAPENERAVIRVCDDGKGIPKELLPRLFDFFMQVEPSEEDSAGGLGLGLALVKRLVELHGGDVEACSDGPGQGSEFIVRLPLTRRSGAA